MLDKKVIKDIQTLTLKKYRQETKLFVAEGPKIVGELIQLLPQNIVGIYATKEWTQNNTNVAAKLITETELQRISKLPTPNQVVAVIKQIETIEPVIKNGWCIYLDAIQDPGNLGTIIRIADWFGISTVVCNEGCAEIYNPKVVQASMGSIARVAAWTDEGGDWIKKQSVSVYAAALNGTSVHEIKETAPGILLIGNESKGISKTVMNFSTHRITIPRVGEAESLNAAVATGILLSHLLK